MKKACFKMALLMVFITPCLSGHAQVNTDGIPKKVVDAFAKKFPNAEETEWLFSEKGLFTASFFDGNDIKEGSFDKNGAWIETLSFLSEGDLPVAVDESVKKSFPNLEYYDSIVMVEKPEGSYYQITLEVDEAYEKMQIDVYGKILKTERVLE